MQLKDKFGDSKCYGGPLNSLDCEFEGKGCVSFNQASPLCKGNDFTEVEDLVDNGRCDIKFMTNNCNFDGALDMIQSPKFGMEGRSARSNVDVIMGIVMPLSKLMANSPFCSMRIGPTKMKK